MSSNVRRSTSMLINNSNQLGKDENGKQSDLLPYKLVGDQVRL